MLCWASCCSFGTSKGVVGGVTLSGKARTTRQRWPGPFSAPAVLTGVHWNDSVPPAKVAAGSVPATFGGRKRRFPGSIRTVLAVGLITRLGCPT
jgi:hypothetical protein